MSDMLCISTSSSSATLVEALIGGGNNFLIASCVSDDKVSGNSILRTRNKFPRIRGFLNVGKPSFGIAFIIRSLLEAFGSEAMNMLHPGRGFLAAKLCSRVPDLK